MMDFIVAPQDGVHRGEREQEKKNYLEEKSISIFRQRVRSRVMFSFDWDGPELGHVFN